MMSIYGENEVVKDELKIIVKQIESIINIHGEQNIMIIVPNEKSSEKLQKALKNNDIDINVDYYKSKNTIGVKSDKRVMIAIGIAQKPTNAFDVYSGNAFYSEQMRDWSVKADTWQAISRVKDPNAEEDSYVYFIGTRVKDAKSVSDWNEYPDIPKSSKPQVHDQFLLKSMEKLNKKTASIDTIDGEQGTLLKNHKKVPTYYIGQKWAFFNKVSLLLPIVSIINVRSHLNQEIRNDKNIPIDFLIKEHLNGTKILSVPRLNKDKTVNFINFEFQLKDIMMAFFNYYKDTHKILIEDFGDNFRMWVFFDKPIPAKDAKEIGKFPIRLYKLKKNHVQLYPEITSQFNKNDTIKLPFSPIKKANQPEVQYMSNIS